MSEPRFSRRAVTIGGGIAAALGLTAIGVTVPRFFLRRYRHSPYDDLFAQLIDRDAAVKVGKAFIAQVKATPNNGAGYSRRPLARLLRSRLERRTLAEVTNSDLAQGALIEVQGWVLPQTLVLLCLLAALED